MKNVSKDVIEGKLGRVYMPDQKVNWFKSNYLFIYLFLFIYVFLVVALFFFFDFLGRRDGSAQQV